MVFLIKMAIYINFHSQERRSQQANRQMEQSNADKILNGVVTSINLKFSGDKGQMETCLAERNVVLSKVERKKADLDRLRQRFETLQKIRLVYSKETMERRSLTTKTLFFL